jgi:hypothetical protein
MSRYIYRYRKAVFVTLLVTNFTYFLSISFISPKITHDLEVLQKYFHSLKPYFILFCIALAPSTAYPQSSNTEFSATLRPVFSWQETRTRNGDVDTQTSLNSRFQLSLRHKINDQTTLQIRFVNRYSTDRNTMKFVLRDHTPAAGSYEAGISTFDIIQLNWKKDRDTDVTIGRFQSRFPLAGFIPKGMDRYYAANLSIAHTDGIWVRRNLSDNWRADLVLGHNGEKGSTHAARAPMRFIEPASRINLFVNMAHRDTRGLWVQRELSMSAYPQSFSRDGSIQNLIVFTGRGMLRLPATVLGGEVWSGAELGIIPSAPFSMDASRVANDRPLMETVSTSWQVAIYLNNAYGRHSLGALYGRADPHWVISSSHRPNNTMSEVRYRFVFTERLNFEFRYRLRTDLFKRTGAAFTQRDNDIYARFTWRF